MKENVWQVHQHKLGSFTEKSVSFLEIIEIHRTLLNKQAAISEELTDAIERNDFVKLSHLLVIRNRIQTAIKEIESLHGDELNFHNSMNCRIGNVLKDAATTVESKGEEILLNVIHNLDKFNHSAHSILEKAILFSNKTFSKGNHLNHIVVKLLVHKASEGLVKLANAFQKRS
ncbi:hypothetical protein ACE38V_06505 [Cytobacillus sp. Hz8]|uniref:hypothetical protein n=1 Tax=Cytobacillus sp. Hz8 TaxID=3347168 RepID=UPI0035DD4D2B